MSNRIRANPQARRRRHHGQPRKPQAQAIAPRIRAARAKLLFLPAYSPDLNPIEQAFAKLKTLLRKLDARTLEATWRGIGHLLDAFTTRRMRQLLHKLRICFSA